MDVFIITHPDYGDALCDERQFAEFSAGGWTKKAEPKALPPVKPPVRP